MSQQPQPQPQPQQLDTVIVGAGPAGLQLAYFLEKAGIPYLVLERGAAAASFFSRYPHSGELISINKRHVGRDNPDFKLRHDWNSLLTIGNEGPHFTTYSKDYYPDRDDLVIYMNDFAKKHGLKIQYETTVRRVRRSGAATESQSYEVLATTADGTELKISCEKLVMATGLSVPDRGGVIDESKRPIKHYADFPKDYFRSDEAQKTYENKSVLIIGNGNSAYELGTLLTPIASTVTIHGQRPKPWAASTHYTGDLRSIYLPFQDTFLLKSLNAINHSALPALIVHQEGGPATPYTLKMLCSKECKTKHDFLIGLNKTGYDEVILCTGWKMDTSLYDFDLPTVMGGKYPRIQPTYESTDHPNLFFIGALMHSLDHKRSSGGFIHGFRYLIDLFFRMNYSKTFDISAYADTKLPDLIAHLIRRMNTSSALYQMHGVLGDAFYYDKTNKRIVVWNGIPSWFLDTKIFKAEPETYVCVMTLEYGQKPVTNIYELGQRVTDIGSESNSTLLHPVLRVYRGVGQEGRHLVDEIHFDENLYTNFTDRDVYYNKLIRTLRMFMV